MPDYLRVIDEQHEEFAAYLLAIKWNVAEFLSGGGGRTGFIVQRVEMSTDREDILGFGKVAYFEAWPVVDGALERDPSELESDPDDSFTFGLGFGEIREALRKSIGTEGSVRYESQVYWVGAGDELYEAVESWKPGSVEHAWNLKSVLADDIPGIEKNLVFKREPFVHEWRFIDEGVVECTVMEYARKATHLADGGGYDVRELDRYLHYVLDNPRYQHLESQIWHGIHHDATERGV